MNTTINRGPAAPTAPGNYAALGASASAIGALSSIGTAYSQASAARSQADFADAMAAINERFTALKAADALRRGEIEAGKVRRGARKTIGRQRAVLGAQGINLAEGTPLEIQEETAALSAADALTIRNNAYREAWGYRTEALTRGASGSMESMGLRFSAGQTLLTGGLAFAREAARGVREYRGGR
jgi:hypothetical protein